MEHDLSPQGKNPEEQRAELPEAVAALNENRTFLRAILESIADSAVITIFPDGRVTDWNAGAENVLGWSKTEVLGQSADLIFPPDARKAGEPELQMRRALAEDRAKDERWYMRKDGTRFWGQGVLTVLRTDRGEVVGFVKILRDQTDQRHAEEELRDSMASFEERVAERTRDMAAANARLQAEIADRKRAEASAAETEQRFRILVEGVTDYALYMLDPTGHIVSWNPGAERVKGYTADEIIGAHFSIFYTEEDKASGEPARALATAAREGKYTKEAWRVRKGGQRIWASVVLDPIWSENGRLIGYAKITRDITERYEAERALEDAREQLFQAQKMEAVGQLTGGIAHDFNNLLTGIIGCLELIQTRLAQGRTGDVGRYVDAAQRGASRAAALTHRLLAFSRRQTLNPKPVDVAELVSSMDELIRRSLGPAIQVETDIRPGLWPTICDPNQLENALLNLCINARDAMPDGGTLTIEAANTCLDTAYVARTADVIAGDYVAVCVTDTGSGMPKDIISRAFEPFFTTKPTGQGTGLGLSMVYGFVKQTGGHVRIYSEEGHGTTVKLYLPRHTGKADADQEGGDCTESPVAGDTETILVVDDDPTVRLLIHDVLTDLGHTVLEAEDGASALRVLQSEPSLDLLVTDVGLPGGMNGRQVADAARIRRPDLKVLFITGYAEAAAITGGFLESGMEILTKPFATELLAAKVRALAARK